MANIDDKKIPKGGVETSIVGRLHDVSEDHVVTGANEVFDDAFGERQSQVNDKLRHYTKMAHIRIDAEEITREHEDTQLRNELNAKQLEIGAVQTDSEPIPESPNILTSGAVAFNLGWYRGNDNPEWVYCITDGAMRLLAGIKRDGSVEWMIGVPTPVKNYVDNHSQELIEKFEEHILEELEKKVDKEEGKSLIDAEYADGVSYIENPEFLDAKTDNSQKLLEGTKVDGTKVFAGDVEIDKNLRLQGKVTDTLRVDKISQEGFVTEVIDNPEWKRVLLTEDGSIVFGIRHDGSIDWSVGVPVPIQKAIEKIYEDGVLNSFKYVSNSEYLLAVTDNADQILIAFKANGDVVFGCGIPSQIKDYLSSLVETFYYIDNPEFISVELDSKGRILKGIKKDGTFVENCAIKTPKVTTDSLVLTEEGMNEFQKALKDSGFNPGGAGDFSDYISNDGEVPLYISEPRCALVNISGITSMPITKNVDLHAYMEVYDYNGNYFKKKVLLNAQGKSSLANPQKNFAVDMFDSDWEGDAFALKIGNWVPQDSFHFKCFYYDPTRGLADVLYKFAENIIKYTDTRANRLATDKEETTVYTDSGNFTFDYDTEVLCHPDGFPVVVYLNGEFFGLFTWNLKKHRDNYMMDKKDYESIHIDSDTANLWSSNNIDWTLFEIRNPKTLICMDGSKYDGDSPKELIDSTSPNYDASNKDHKNTVKTKNLINTLHTVVPMINAASTNAEKKALFEQYFDVDSFIVFWIISQVIDNYDGLWGRNTQWLYYKKSGKWCPTLYDLDSCLGYLAGVPWLKNPVNEVLASNTALPYGLLWSLYQNEIELKYKELRNAGLISTDLLVSMVIDWCNRFGLFNIERNIKKWNTPCYRDGKINGDYWVLDGYNLTVNVRESEKYDNSKQYNAGDVTYFGVTSIYTMRYKCKAACVGEIPAGKYDEAPFYGGCFDSPRRIRKWMDEKLSYLDSLFNL